MNTKSKKALVGLAVIYGVIAVWGIYLLVQNPLNLAIVSNPTFFEVAKSGEVPDKEVFLMGLREFYTLDTLLVTSRVAALFELDIASMSLAGIGEMTTTDSIELPAYADGLLLGEFTTHDGVHISFFSLDTESLHAFFLGDSIIVVGQ